MQHDFYLDNWNEIRTAAAVAKLGTVTQAATALGVHRATVNRHIDHLEVSLGAKLFQRHARGFAPTELGFELLRIADATNAQFSELQRLAKKQKEELSGELVVTAVDVLGPLLLPVINDFQQEHPKVRTQFIISDHVLKLEYGEAHIAFRFGCKPTHPDNVVRPFKVMRMGLYAALPYIDRYDLPRHEGDYPNHFFVGSGTNTPKAPFLEWIGRKIPAGNIAFTSNSIALLWSAVLAGTGIGFLPTMMAERRDDLVEILAPQPQWDEPTWIVTHVDLHRTLKIQRFLAILDRGMESGSV